MLRMRVVFSLGVGRIAEKMERLAIFGSTILPLVGRMVGLSFFLFGASRGASRDLDPAGHRLMYLRKFRTGWSGLYSLGCPMSPWPST